MIPLLITLVIIIISQIGLIKGHIKYESYAIIIILALILQQLVYIVETLI